MARVETVTGEQRTQLGCKLKMWRKFRGLTRVELAEKSGISESKIASCERGKTYLTDETILRVADVLKISPQVLEDREFADAPGIWYGSIPWKLLTGDWRLYTADEIAAELDTTYSTVHTCLCKLKRQGYAVLYTHLKHGTGERLDPPVRSLSPRKVVSHSHCKGCRYGLTKGTSMPSGCLYYCYTGKHRPNPVNGQCPAKDTNKRARNVYKGVR